ncbi:hypothetical protein [Lysinibacillus xylanilyticus]|uniref:hypothetical protein n=1 Tax=Lysinibacillus xylanilyticus TaxID=582475 RepID=UPI0036DE8277
MLTVITFEELEKLYRDGKLTKSETFDFLQQPIQKFLEEIFKEEKQGTMARLIHVHSVNGTLITEINKEALDDFNDDILGFLPGLEGEEILIITNASDKVLHFSDTTLDDFEEASLDTDEDKEFYRDVLLEPVEDDSACVYAVSEAIELKNVVAVVYAEDMEERVAVVKEANKGRDVLFKPTAMFS